MSLNQISINDTTTVNTGIVYDISKTHNGSTYTDLADALGTDGINVPLEVREGGMSVRFVLMSDNKYEQYRLMADEFTTDTTQWVIAEESVYVENPEFIKCHCDADGRLLWWIEKNGTVGWSKGIPAPIQEELRKLEQLITEGDESVIARVAANETAIVAINDALNNYKDEVSEALSKKMDGEYIDGTEYIHVYIDGEDKKIWSLSNSGNLKHYTHNEFNSISIFDKMSMGEVEDTYIVNSEEYLKIIIDAEDRIIFSVKPNGSCFCDLEGIAKIKSIIDEIQSELPKKDLDLLDELLDNPLSEIKTTPELAASFRSWGFIGDSLASGEHEYTKEDGSKGFIDIYEYSWGAHICRMCGVSYSPLTSIPDGSDPDNCNGYNYSYGGQTSWGWIQAGVRGWLGAQKHPKQGYILALGVNDYSYIRKYDTYKPLIDNAISKGSIDYQLTANESKVITDSTGTSQGIITKVKSMIDNSLVTALTYNNIQYYAISYSGDTVVFAAYDTETRINTIMAKDVSNEATWSIEPLQYGVALGNIESDIDLEDFNNNANTYIGNYAGIVQRLRSVSPRCRIFTVTPPNIPLAQTVRDISTLFDNVFVIDLDKYVGYLYSNSTFRSRYFLGGHMNAAGYLWTAYVFMTYISWYIRKEPEKFSELAFWDSDKHI